jgi:hypothetical protein
MPDDILPPTCVVDVSPYLIKMLTSSFHFAHHFGSEQFHFVPVTTTATEHVVSFDWSRLDNKWPRPPCTSMGKYNRPVKVYLYPSRS